MTMDKSLRTSLGLVRARGVLSRGERIAKLQEMDRFPEGRSPLGLPKVRVMKLSMKKKKKAKEEGAEGTAAAAPAAAAGARVPQGRRVPHRCQSRCSGCQGCRAGQGCWRQEVILASWPRWRLLRDCSRRRPAALWQAGLRAIDP